MEVYDEMLEHRMLLEHRTVLNTDIPDAQSDAAIWSGLRTNDQAVIRAFTQGPCPVAFAVSPWGDTSQIQLRATPEGVTYLLTRKEGKIEVRP